MCGEDEEHRQGVRPEDPEQVGDVEESRDCLFSRGEGRPGVRRQEVDHKSSLCLSRYYKFSKYTLIIGRVLNWLNHS